MANLVSDPERYLKRALGSRSRVLLINPPVEERRYHWLRWNQPLELLRLSSWLRKQERRTNVRMFDFMFPDEAGVVLKHKVKESWTGATNDEQLWHFGRPFDAFEEFFRTLLFTEAWIPDVIVITSLTSYWHKSIEKLLNKIYAHLGRRHRRCVKVCLYGNYPRCEPAHAASQDADVAFTRTVDTTGCFPDFPIYMAECGRLPSFFGLDIEDRDVAEHLRECLALQARTQRERGSTRAAILTVAFFN